ncbi:L,D-transpeptidase [Aciditerrimonas ferrireducens]|uniref:L,D-transpeptidase n=1 Tax=Aciditerrimonas ferrireducens TaxID=667306 RepID=A0ABV6C0V7_9ACTN
MAGSTAPPSSARRSRPGELTSPAAARALARAAARRRAAVRRRRTVLVALVAVLVGLLVVVWPSGRAAVAVHRVASPAPVPAVVATSPPMDGAPVPPTEVVELRTTTESGVEVAEARLSPPVAGSWRWCEEDLLCFQPSSPYPFGARETLSLPLRQPARAGHPAHESTFELTFQVVAGESVGLAQDLLAQLGYLPLRPPGTLQPLPGSSRPGDADGDPDDVGVLTSAAGEGLTLAQSLGWRWPSVPSSLRALWTPGTKGVMTDGAIVQFDRVEGLESGSYPPYQATLTPAFWQALLRAALANRRDPDDYAYAMVSEQEPETLVVWSDGQDALRTLVNTGIPGGATPVGTWPVYLRYPEQTMRGTTVTGQPYVYPDVKDVNYFTGNIAIHAFPRARYGFPQSQGCVEVPPSVAPEVYALLHYGSLVTVQA